MANYDTTTQLQLTRNYLDGGISANARGNTTDTITIGLGEDKFTNDDTFQPSNQFASKAVVHPEFQPEADGFMKLGDIKGESFHGNAAGDPLPTEEIISNHGNRSNWDVICDVGTSIKQSGVADALTNAGQQGYTEIEWTYLKGDVWTNGSATSRRDGITGSGFHDGLVNGAVHPDMPMDTHPNDIRLGYPGAGTDLRSDNRFVFEPLNAMNSFGDSFDPGLDGANGFKPREVSAVQIGEPPEPKLWLQMLG